MSDSIVIIPTYNEKENVEAMIRKVFSLSQAFDVLIIDDGSPDGTADIVKRLQKEFPNQLHIEERKGKLGLGTAYIHGFRWALKNNYEYIFEMDADFSHDPKYLKGFIQKIDEGYDLVIGSRYIDGISVLNWPLRRLILSYLASVYTRAVTGLKVMDTTAGFMCYKVNSLKQIDLDNVRSNGYSFQIEMKFKMYKKGFKIIEVPILFIDRREGESKMSRKVVYEAYFMVWKLKFKSVFGKL